MTSRVSAKSSSSFSSSSFAPIPTSSSLAEFTSSEFGGLTESSSSSLTSGNVRSTAFVTITVDPPTTTHTPLPTIPVVTESSKRPSPSLNPAALFPSASSTVSHPAQSNQNGPNTAVIAIIVALSVAFVLVLVVGTVFFLRRRRRMRKSHNNDGVSRNINHDEKYDTAERSQYIPSIAHRKSMMDQGMTPLLTVPSIGQHSRTSSLSSDLENHMYHEGLTSPFLNESEKLAERNAGLDAGSYAQPGDAGLEAVVTLPAPTSDPAPPKTSRAMDRTSTLQIADAYRTAPPSRRPSKGKNWKRGSSTNTNVPTDTGDDSDDSASLYSQASASTHRTYATRHSTIPTFPYPSIPLPSIPQSPSNKITKAEDGLDEVHEGASTPSDYTSSPIDSFGREEEGTGRLGKEETLRVATLIQSRLSRAPNPAPPTRSSSIVSHIERAGSIKPVLTPLETGTTSRYPRGSRAKRARDVVKSQVLSS